MCTRPCAGSSIPGAATLTNAPKTAIETTVPSSHSSWPTASKGVKSTWGTGSRTTSSFMLRLSLPAASSTDTTRTCTSCPTSISSSMFLMGRSLIWATCTMPSRIAPFPDNVTSTNAPNGCTLWTIPLCHVEGSTPMKGLCFRMLKLIFPAASSTLTTRTCTSCPTLTSSSIFSRKPSLIWDTCTRPSSVAPFPDKVTLTMAP
mmetsp:Transcript_56729/g.172702  ORF Transcript_56729/g.172702 Transcript_56729/m.172702 type:complete len:203 (+) Transcript_56729:230-838(+)